MAKKQIEYVDVSPVVVTAKIYEVTIAGFDSILFNRMPMLDQPKSELKNAAKKDPTAEEWAHWRDKLYVDDQGMTFIPGENIHECLKEGSKYWGQKIPGEGNKTYTDVVASSVIVGALNLGIPKDSDSFLPDGRMVNGNPSKGKKSGAKVFKIRPLLRPWGGTFTMHVFDGRLNIPVLKTILTYSGSFKGLCDWRPKFGRFNLEKIELVGGQA